MTFLNKNKKKNFLVFFFAFLFIGSGFFFSGIQSAYANTFMDCGFNGSFVDCVKSGGEVNPAGGISGMIEFAFKSVLYGIFIVFGWLVSVAVTLFGWVIDPAHISGDTGFLNRQSIYDLWKFIRDFFNLFFIIILLYTAFTIVFQVAKDYKKALLNLVIMALLVNFSFPISRFIIDTANVPMYYFANIMMTDERGAQGSLGTVLKTSKLKEILLPGSEGEGMDFLQGTDVSRLIAAIIFMFIFGITILVLAVMFLIRLIALIILVIFSSAGFALTVMPGLGRYANMWWDNLLRYAFFGPAAMLMVMVSIRFFADIGNDASALGMREVAGGVTSSPVQEGFIASMAFFGIPIVMLWMSMSVAQSMSIFGAGAVVGKGRGFAKWAGKKVYNNPVGRGVYGGVKKAGTEGKIAGINYGKTPLIGKYLTGKYWAEPSKTEATIKGGIAGGWGGGKKERDKLHQQAVNDRIKKDKENQVNNSVHRQNLRSGDLVEREAAALALANDKEIRTAEELSLAMQALANNSDGLTKVIENAQPQAIKNMDSAAYATARDMHYERNRDGSFVRDAAGNRVVKDGMQKSVEALDNRTKKEGNAKALVDYELTQLLGSGAANASTYQVQDAVEKVLKGMKSHKDVANSESLFNDARYGSHAVTYVKSQGNDRVQAVKKASAEEGTTVGVRIV